MRVRLAQSIWREPKPIKRPRLEVLQKHIRPLKKLCKRRLALRAHKVKRNTLLASIEPNKIARLPLGHIIIATGKIPLWTLDLDDMRPGICKAARRIGRGHGLLDCDNLNPFKRTHQNDLGIPRTCSATKDRIRFVEIGAT